MDAKYERKLRALVAEIARHERKKGRRADITDRALHFRAKEINRRA